MPTLQTSRLFDENYDIITHYFGGSYPRLSYEPNKATFLIQDNRDFKKYPKEEIFELNGAKIYDEKYLTSLQSNN
jgi:hypothetical protein